MRSNFPANIEIQHDLYEGSDRILGNPTETHEIIMNLSTKAYHAMEKTVLARDLLLKIRSVLDLKKGG